ncbi:MAG TPA: NAD(P)/FAD-dependent oxidoreductase [Pyrinomonadaceae bacterium]|jgi:flavin-dependent dehydrogenase|nr:NAD(P)/FAD-dependent oxidoreductase [Pyrinomonadaceae bacterium]
MDSANTFDVAIAGAGPAGSSVAIELALNGARVLLIEEKKFPRAKLCGEFISPECLAHFKRLGVMEQMSASGGASVAETVFYSRRGKSVAVPSEWFKSGTRALGLSRSEMDQQLLERAKSVGVIVMQEAHATPLLQERERVSGLRVRSGNQTTDYHALVTIDATGRTRALARQLDPPRANRRKNVKPLVAFKVHLQHARVAPGACEIYFYQRGYGGLSSVEGGVTNLCFIVGAKDVRRYNSDPELVLREVVMKNSRAAYTLAEARAVTPWLSVSLESFGRRTVVPAAGLLAAGDAAAFIDPFTGSGMLIAMESGQLAAESINRHLLDLRRGNGFEKMASDYQAEYSRRFESRLRVSGLLRRAAFVPHLDEAAIPLFALSAQLRRKLARATRHSTSREASASSL